jgi:hypothetical protein
MTDEPRWLTEAQLDQIEERCNAASKPPWESFLESQGGFGGNSFIRVGGMDDNEPDMYVSRDVVGGLVPASDDDLNFIAYARQDLPHLLAEVRRQRAAQGAAGDPAEAEAGAVSSRQDLAEFVRQLRAELLAGGAWENDDLASFLEAMSAWINDSPGAYNYRGEPVPIAASWSFLADALRAATLYE